MGKRSWVVLSRLLLVAAYLLGLKEHLLEYLGFERIVGEGEGFAVKKRSGVKQHITVNLTNFTPLPQNTFCEEEILK
jgi:hypothetical protein